MKFYKDIITHIDKLGEPPKYAYHEWSPESIKRYWSVCTNNPFIQAQFYPREYWEDLLRWASKKMSIAPSKIIDVGCGNGNLIDCIRTIYRNTSICGVDLSKDSFEPAKQRFAKDKNIQFKVGSLERLPFDDRSLDLVVCTEVLEHTFPETFTRSFPEVNRVLRAGGYFLASVPFDEKIAVVCCPGCGSIFTPYQHMLFEISHDDICSLLSNNNFELVEFYQALDRSHPANQLKRLLKPALIKWLPTFAGRIFPRAGVSGFLAHKTN